MDPTLEWLLEPSEPAVRARALVDLAGLPPSHPEVREAVAAIPRRGRAQTLLEGLSPTEDPLALYVPKYVAPFHRLVALAEMGVPGDASPAGEILDRLLSSMAKPDGGFGNPRREGPGHLCVTGNLARAAITMGRAESPQVKAALKWLVAQQRPDGGWHCFPDESNGGTLDAWEPLAAFAALAPGDRGPGIDRAIERGVEFLLEARLGAEDPYEPWRRFHFPHHYFYDVLLGLDLATTLGDPRDARLQPALDLLRKKEDADGRWALDAQHPDLGPGTEYSPHPPSYPVPVTPLVVDAAGAPSRWVTLAARRVLEKTR